MSDFSNYELTPGLNVQSLAGGVVPAIAGAAEVPLTPYPARNSDGGAPQGLPEAGLAIEADLKALVGKVGPDKELQQNISAVRETLGPDAREQIAEWVERSGILYPVERSFKTTEPMPKKTDAVVWGGGVANWMLRRATVTERFDPDNVGRIYLPLGNRPVKAGEHQLAGTYEKQRGRLPKEHEFVRTYILDRLVTAGFDPKPKVIPVASGVGDKVLDALFEREPQLLDGTITVVANAPNAIQAAGQLRLAALRVDPSFDSTGEQLFVASDSVPLARRGEAAKTHQNPETALGQLVRNALFLQANINQGELRPQDADRAGN